MLPVGVGANTEVAEVVARLGQRDRRCRPWRLSLIWALRKHRWPVRALDERQRRAVGVQARVALDCGPGAFASVAVFLPAAPLTQQDVLVVVVGDLREPAETSILTSRRRRPSCPRPGRCRTACPASPSSNDAVLGFGASLRSPTSSRSRRGRRPATAGTTMSPSPPPLPPPAGGVRLGARRRRSCRVAPLGAGPALRRHQEDADRLALAWPTWPAAGIWLLICRRVEAGCGDAGPRVSFLRAQRLVGVAAVLPVTVGATVTLPSPMAVDDVRRASSFSTFCAGAGVWSITVPGWTLGSDWSPRSGRASGSASVSVFSASNGDFAPTTSGTVTFFGRQQVDQRSRAMSSSRSSGNAATTAATASGGRRAWVGSSGGPAGARRSRRRRRASA